MSATVTVFDPQGTLRDIPQTELQNAVKQGGTPGVRVQAPDGQIHIVPAPKIQEAAQNGGKVLPFDDQEPTLTKSFGDYVHDFGKHMWTAVEQSAGAPAIANELYKKWSGQPNQLKEMIPRAVMTFASAGGFEGELGAAFDSAPKPAAVSEVPAQPKSLLDVAKQDVKAYVTKKIPFGSKLGLATKPATIADYWNALTQSPENTAAPVAKPPEVPASQANPEQFSFSHRQTGPAYSPGGPVRTSTAVNAAPSQPTPVIPTSPGFQVPPVREPVPIKTPLKASDFATATKEVVDAAVPPANKGANMEATAKVNFYLKKGDVPAAEKVLDQVAAKVNPNWPPDAPQFRGGTNDIREATRYKTPADIQEDRAIQQEMVQNLERHGQMAEEDARKEFIARNSTGITKGELTGQLPSAQGQAIREANAAKVQGGATPTGKIPNPIPRAAAEIATDDELTALGKAKANDDFKIQRVPIEQVTTRQPYLEATGGKSSGVAEGYQTSDGTYVVTDGNHRIADALKRGDKSVNLKVWNASASASQSQATALTAASKAAEFGDLFTVSRTALDNPTKFDRMQYVLKEYLKAHPEASRKQTWLDITDAFSPTTPVPTAPAVKLESLAGTGDLTQILQKSLKIAKSRRPSR